MSAAPATRPGWERVNAIRSVLFGLPIRQLPEAPRLRLAGMLNELSEYTTRLELQVGTLIEQITAGRADERELQDEVVQLREALQWIAANTAEPDAQAIADDALDLSALEGKTP